MGQLFDKPMSELRETFVRTRFAEPDMFGRPDIEEWLAQQRTAKKPDEELWEQLLQRPSVWKWANRDFFDLRTHATSLGLLNAQFGSLGETNEYGPIFDLMAFHSPGNDPKRGLYSSVEGLLYVVDHIHGPMFVIRKETDGSLTIVRVRNLTHAFAARAILGAVFEEWAHNRPNWEAARRAMYQLFTEEIDHERKTAQRDFDEAVAVSADGTKIVKADEVVVILDDRRVVVYSASAFIGHKILRSTDMKRYQLQYVEKSRGSVIGDAYVTWMLNSITMTHALTSNKQCFEPAARNDGKARLITNACYCPSPLPEGGREIRV